VLADSPVAYWKLDETSSAAPTATDAAGGSAWTFGTGVVGGQTAVVADGGTSVHGDGVNPIATLASVPTAVNGDNVTLEAWVHLPGTNVKGSFVKVGSSSNGWGMGIGGTQWDNVGQKLIVLSETKAWHPTTYTFPGAGNYHVMVVRGASGAVTAYVNGTSVWTGTLTAPVTASGQMGVGGYSEGFGFKLSSSVTIDNVAIFASALSSGRVTAHYNSGSGDNAAITADSPTVWLKLDETSTQVGAVDSSGNGRLMSYSATVPVIGQTSLLGDGSGKSITINSTAQYLTIASASWMDTPSGLTVEARIKPTAGVLAAGGFIASRWGGSAGNSDWLIGVTSTGKLTASVYTGGVSRTATGATTLTADTVYTAALRWSSALGLLEVVLNGVSDGSASASGSLATAAVPIELARAALTGGSGISWGGGIDEVSVTASALSDTRMAARHAAAIATGGTAQSFTGSPSALAVTAPAGSFTAGTTIPAAFTGAPTSLTVTAPLGDVAAGTAVAADFTGTPATLTVAAPLGDVVTSAPVAQDFTGTPSSITIAAPAGGYLLSSGAAEDVTDAVEDAADPIALTIGAAESLTDSVVDAADPIRYAVDQIDAIAEAWAEAYDTLTVTLDPDTLRPQYRIKVVDHAGNTICELADAQIGTATRSLNGRGGLDFSLGKNDPQLASVPQFAEVQLWRGAHLVPGGWFTVVDPQIDEGGDTFDYQCSGLTYYFERRLIGAERPEMLRNGGFEQGSRFWSGGWSPGSNAETPPTFEITSDALEGGKALRIFAADKVASIKRTVESAAVFVPNRATFLSGGEQAIRDQVSDIPNGTHITVEGHTADADGGDGYALSVARAEAAAAVIHAYKPTLVITTVGKGETEPVDPRHTEAAYKKNRRVVILANVVQTKVGHRQFEHQSFTASQPASAREPLEFDIQGQGRIDTFEGPSKDGWMLYADVRKVGDPKHLILNNDHVDVDESTARQAWMGLNLTVKVPADGLDYVVDVRLYPTAGSSSFDQISAKPNLKLAFWDADPRHIIGGLVEHAQDGTLGKSDLNIQAYGPLSGFTTSRSWEWKEAKPVSEAIDDMVRSLNGPDANIAVTPRRRWLVIHPKQGRDSGFVLAAGDCAGDARIIGYAAGVDGDNVTTQARVQTSWSGGGMVEQFVTLPRADGLTLENVYQADQDTPSSALLEQGRTAVKYGQADVVTRVAMHPDDTTLLMERVTIGDIVTLAIKDGRVDVNLPYRIIQIDLDPNTDQLAYVVAPEV
jgi:outer membrane protein OmpA-like peptidoglycan-associated protein